MTSFPSKLAPLTPAPESPVSRPGVSFFPPPQDTSGTSSPPSANPRAEGGAGGRVWTVVFPPGMEILTGNNRLHWSAKGRLVKALRDTAWGQAKRLKLPTIERADVVVEYRPPAHRGPLSSAMIRDADNLAPTGKALVDGLTMAGVFPQDTAKHVRRVSYEFGPKSDRGQVLVHITEVAP